LQVPANRIGYTAMSLPQLKILQEVITLIVFVPFAVFYMRQPLKLDFVWAALCIVGAVYFRLQEVNMNAGNAPTAIHARVEACRAGSSTRPSSHGSRAAGS
jgi:hypothetical protein